jgi:glycosyltransferase involved in cell wall biosynthesis
MRLLALLNGGADHPSSRFRVLQHLEVLRARGIEAEIVVAKRGSGYAPLQLRRLAAGHDVILIQKKLFSPWKLRLLPRRIPVVYDFDDAVFEVSPDEEDRFGRERAEKRARSRRRRLRATLVRAGLVLAGNRFLAEGAQAVLSTEAGGSAGAGGCYGEPRVVVLPTGVDLAPFPEARVREALLRRAGAKQPPRIGWIGSRPSLRYLAMLAAPLRAACTRVPGARLVEVCNEFLDLPGVPVEKRLWSAAREADDLLDFDVGLMPIDDRPFSSGKCGLKILQYQAAGVPVVCSPVGANTDIVRDGATGLYATGEAAWTEAIVRLLSDRPLASRLAEAGRRRLEAEYAAAVVGTRLAEHLLATARPRGARSLNAAGAEREEDEGEREPQDHQRLLVADHLGERPALGSFREPPR